MSSRLRGQARNTSIKYIKCNPSISQAQSWLKEGGVFFQEKWWGQELKCIRQSRYWETSEIKKKNDMPGGMNLMNQYKVSKWCIESGVGGTHKVAQLARPQRVQRVSDSWDTGPALCTWSKQLHWPQQGEPWTWMDVPHTSLKSIILEQKNFHSFWCWTPPVKWPHQLQPLSCRRLWINLSRKRKVILRLCVCLALTSVSQSLLKMPSLQRRKPNWEATPSHTLLEKWLFEVSGLFSSSYSHLGLKITSNPVCYSLLNIL